MREKNRWSALSIKDRADLINLYISNGYTSLEDIKKHYNSFGGGGEKDSITKEQQVIIDKVNNSNADFAIRLRQTNRATIPAHEDSSKVATHRLSVATDENGIHYLFPQVQNINGLYDFTDPKYGRTEQQIWRDSEASAIERRDTVQIGKSKKDLEEAINFTKTYKDLEIFPKFMYGGNQNMIKKNDTNTIYHDNTDIEPAVVIGASNETSNFFKDFSDRYQKLNKKDVSKYISNIVNTDTAIKYKNVKRAGEYSPITNRIKLNIVSPAIYTHELTHKINDNLNFFNKPRRTRAEKKILKEAYKLGNKNAAGFIYGLIAGNKEYFTTNTQLRRIISEKNNNVLGDELNNIIISMPSEELVRLASNLGYTAAEDYYKYKENIKSGEDLYNTLYKDYEDFVPWENLTTDKKQYYNTAFKQNKAVRSRAGEIDENRIYKIKNALINVAKYGGRILEGTEQEQTLSGDNPTTLETEPLYYDDTPIEPAVVKAFNSQEDYNRYYGEQFGRKVARRRDEIAQNIFKGLQYVPIVGDAVDATDAFVSLKDGNISKAAVLAGTLLMPNILEKPVKAVSKGIKNLKIYNKYTKDAERFRDAVNYSTDKYARRADLLNGSYGGTYKLNTAEDIKRAAYNQPISTDFRIQSLFPRVGGKYNTITDEIWLNRFRPALFKAAWNNPRKAIRLLNDTAAHEGTHLALNHLNDRLSIPGKRYYIANTQHPLYDRVGYAFSDPNRESTTWARNPEEFVANMTKVGYHFNINPALNVRDWNINHKQRLSNYLSKNHGFTPEDALFLAEELSDFGYKNGGKLNKLDGTEDEQTLSGLPILGITEYYDTYKDKVSPVKVVPDVPIDENELVKRQAWAESAGNDRAGSSKGAKGRYQIMPNTLSEYQRATRDIGNIYDPVYNRRVRDWEFNRYKNSDQVNRGEPSDSVKMARRLAIYNYGYGNTRKALNKADSLGLDTDNSFDWLQVFPQETEDYINFILRNKDTGAHRTNEAYRNRKK